MNAASMNVHTATANIKMSVPNTFITVLPWSSSELENKRFKTITLVVLCITLAFAAVVKWQELPERDRADKEKVPAQLAKKVAESINIPVIGIGAGAGVDGQVLVLHDMLGMNHEFNPRFLRRYLNLADDITGAVQSYVSDVKSTDFPNEKEQY